MLCWGCTCGASTACVHPGTRLKAQGQRPVVVPSCFQALLYDLLLTMLCHLCPQQRGGMGPGNLPGPGGAAGPDDGMVVSGDRVVPAWHGQGLWSQARRTVLKIHLFNKDPVMNVCALLNEEAVMEDIKARAFEFDIFGKDAERDIKFKAVCAGFRSQCMLCLHCKHWQCGWHPCRVGSTGGMACEQPSNATAESKLMHDFCRMHILRHLPLACCSLQWWNFKNRGETSRPKMGGAQALAHAHKEMIWKLADNARGGFLAYHHIHNLSPKNMTAEQKQVRTAVQWGCVSCCPGME
jgi:hypothetical protein